MKKIFLVFGIAAYTSASAQNKDLFDIQDHLRKKTAESNKVGRIFRNPPPYEGGFQRLSGNEIGGSIVMIPRNGGMPYVKPDIRQFQTMPNPGLGNFTTNIIPNGALPKPPRILIK